MQLILSSCMLCEPYSKLVECIASSLSPRPVGGSLRAGIAVIISCCSPCDARLVMIEKARGSSGYPWSGDMAFPGGVRKGGESIVDTIYREVYEEVCIERRDLLPLGFLEPAWPLNAPSLLVAPLVALHLKKCSNVPRRPCSREAARVALVPLPSSLNEVSFLHPVRMKVFRGHKDWYGNIVWGMSFRVLKRLLKVVSTCAMRTVF